MKEATASKTPDQSDTGATGPLTLNDRLSLISLIEEGMRGGSREAPIVSDLFSNLWDLVAATAKGAKVNRLNSKDTGGSFKVLEINSEQGETLGRLNMLYMNKPMPCYYLVYVEVAAPYRNRGLGHLVLRHFADFLEEKGAIGLLDNIIPKDDPTNDIYDKHDWRSVRSLIGNNLEGFDDYMLFVPHRHKDLELRDPVVRSVHHLVRRREAIDMKDNEGMVRQTLDEFKALHAALMTYFKTQIEAETETPLMRFMFTRFVTKLIAFRRRISDLLGYTGGESLRQITLHPFVSGLPIQSYAPPELAGESDPVFSDAGAMDRLPSEILENPSRTIEALPNYQRPSLSMWLTEKDKSGTTVLTIGDLMDIGFDPTRLKEIEIDGESYIFERIQARQVPLIEHIRSLLAKASRTMAGQRAGKAELKINPPLLAIRNRGNAYILRKKIPGIHWEEAMAQLQGNPALKSLNAATNADRLIVGSVRKAARAAAEMLEMKEPIVRDTLSFFISWDLEANRPKIMVDPSGTALETIWLA